MTSTTIYELLKKFKNAPKDVKTPLIQLRTFEALLKELEVQLEEPKNISPLQDTLHLVWRSSLEQMRQDIQ